VLTGRGFFPQLISAPFRDGLHAAFAFAITACLIAAAASLLRGGRVEAGEGREVVQERRTASESRVMAGA